ncbi:ATP-dependent DNA helicase [bacterium]|nr:ATP-dependent DNA helicase [bacterium]
MRQTGIKLKENRIRVSVRELVEQVLQHGDLHASFGTQKRALEGTMGHQTVQKQRGESYRREVSVSYTVNDHPLGIELDIQGRIDGVFKEEDQFVIEEIKTTYSSLDELDPDESGSHFAQARIYAFLFADQFKLKSIKVNLTYFQLKSSQTKIFSRQYTSDELKKFFDFIVNNYLESIRELYEWREIRDQSINTLVFPFSEFRRGQEEFMNEVMNAIASGVNLFAQAPTGLGKTISVLFPAIKSMVAGYNSKIFYLTARTTTREAPEQALEHLRKQGLRLKSIVITAKEKTCLKSEMICSPDHCEFLFNYFGKIKGAIHDIYCHDSFNKQQIETYARKHRVCPFELSLDLSLVSDCIICDYNYFFDPRVQLARYKSETRQPFVYLVDEAHNLVERSRSMYSAEIQKSDFLALKRLVNRSKFEVLYQCLDTLDRFLLETRKSCFEEKQYEVARKQLPDELIDYLIDLLEPAESLLSSGEPLPFRDQLLDLYYQVSFFIKINQLKNGTNAYTVTMYRKQSNLLIKLLCLNATEMIKEKTEMGLSTIFFSATLTPTEYFIDLLGGSENDRFIQLPSPFPEKNRCLCLVDHISTRYRDRIHTYDQIAAYLSVYLQQKQGNYLVFFPSYQYLEEIYSRCTNLALNLTLIRQESFMREEERESFIAEFKEDNSKTLVGFVVMGGIFGESIDLPGDRLTGTVIVGVGLPQINMERNLIRDYFDKSSGKGFNYAYTYPGMNKVLQAAGRLIRTETDLGTLLLIDDRFGSGLYKRLYPPEWKTIHIIKNEETLNLVLRDFWNSHTVDC